MKVMINNKGGAHGAALSSELLTRRQTEEFLLSGTATFETACVAPPRLRIHTGGGDLYRLPLT